MSEWLGRLPSALRAVVILLAVFIPLLVVFVATGEPIGPAIVQAAFWAILAMFAALVGRAMGMRRRGGGPGPPQ
jgi:hypothetical protein